MSEALRRIYLAVCVERFACACGEDCNRPEPGSAFDPGIVAEHVIEDVEALRAQLAAAQAQVVAFADLHQAATERLARIERGPDVDLVWRVCVNAGRGRPRAPRWTHVKAATGVGSTTAREWCRQSGRDPDEEVGDGAEAGRCRACGGSGKLEVDGTPALESECEWCRGKGTPDEGGGR